MTTGSQKDNNTSIILSMGFHMHDRGRGLPKLHLSGSCSGSGLAPIHLAHLKQ
jgi:hypothetical protein